MNKIRANVTAMPVTTAEPTTPTTKITEELLLCRLCSLKYRADGRRPIALRCVHTFCELCLEKLLRDQADSNDATKQRRNKRQQLVCPTCQAVTPLGKGCSPSSLPVNPSIMELLGILGRPVSDGQQHRRQVGSNENAAGYSPVTIIRTSHGQGSGANDQVSPEQKNTMAALIQSKKDRRNGFDLVNHLSRADTDEGGGGKGNSANWVSTVNVVASAAQQQQQQQQQPQQQCGQSFSAAKTSSVPTAMTSTVSSVSTVKTGQQQSCSASTSDTNARPTSTAPGGGVASQAAHRCCRCGLRPAAVSVASSSQTMAPQKLCSDCWNQPAKRIRDDDDQKRGLESAADAGQSARTTNGAKQQPETICVTASGRLSTAKTDGRSGVSSSVTLTPQTARNSHGASKKSDDSSSVARDRPAAAGLVDNTTSTIEVRRRPTYVDKRARTAPSSSTQDNDQSPTVGTDGTGAAVDQPVQSTTVQPPDASYSSVPRQPSTVTMQQRSPSVGTSSETQQRSAVPDTMSEASRGSNAATSRSTNHAGERDSSSFQCSAPTIADIHPLPCSNPPYNPDFNEIDDAGWSSAQQRHRGASNAPTGAGPNRYPPETPIHEKHRQKEQEQRDISAPTGTGVALSFLLTNTRHQYPADQPPKYEDIIRENEPLPATAPEAAAAGPTTTQAVLPTPNEPVVASGGPAAAAAVKLVRSFGKYGEISTQPGAFRAPCSISVTAAVREVTLTRIVVGDSANGTAQVFGDAGECLSMLRADAVRGCCLINDNKKLLLGTDRGVEVYDINGSRQEIIPLGAVRNVVPYNGGFIAVQPKSLSVFKGSSSSKQARTLTSKAKPGQYNRLLQFDDICDVAVNSHHDLVVLEAASGGLITVMTDDGYIKSTISAAKLEGCGPLQAPSAVAVDSAHNIVVSESGRGARVLLFGANGRLQRVLLGPSCPSAAALAESRSSDAGPWAAGLAVGPDDRLYAIIRAEKFAEIRVYEYL